MIKLKLNDEKQSKIETAVRNAIQKCRKTEQKAILNRGRNTDSIAWIIWNTQQNT